MGRRTCVRIGHLLRLGCLQDTEVHTLDRRLVGLSPGQIPASPVCDPCRLVATRPSGRAVSASERCRLCKWLGPRVHCPWAPRVGPARYADGVSAALGPPCAAPLRRQVAPWRGPVRLPAHRCTHMRNQARLGARYLAGGRAATQGFYAADARSSLPMAGRWVACRCGARPCQSPRRQSGEYER